MKQVSKTELSPDNGCVIDTKWKVGPLSYHACAASPKDAHGKPLEGNLRLPETTNRVVVFAHGSGSSRFSPRNRFCGTAH